MTIEQNLPAVAGPVERRVIQPIFERANCEKCGAYAPIETGITDDGQEWWEQYCDACDTSMGDVV